MMKDIIKDYFLDKPGTFENDVDHKHITLNLASEQLVEITTNSIEVKLNKQMSEQLHGKFRCTRTIKKEGQFEWNEIPIDDGISLNDLYEIIDHSYESAMDALPENEQREVLDLEW